MMTVILIIISAFILLVIAGHIKGPPKPSDMTTDNLIWRINSEEKWINRYLRFPYETQQSKSLKKKFEEKQIYKMELILELQKRGMSKEDQSEDKTLLPVLQRTLELVRKGMNEEEAKKQAMDEYLNRKEERDNKNKEDA